MAVQDISYPEEVPNLIGYYSPEGTTLRTKPESSQIHAVVSVNTAHTKLHILFLILPISFSPFKHLLPISFFESDPRGYLLCLITF